ncbi:MAG: hypothetical protein C4567_00505 [Deltaproteobacteria bacterium]|nr:MAG: hypothetical protein C4567_00505 [Deltaproteobacteria bacterium]
MMMVLWLGGAAQAAQQYELSLLASHDLVECIESRSGLHQLEYMKTLHMGNDQYELILSNIAPAGLQGANGL